MSKIYTSKKNEESSKFTIQDKPLKEPIKPLLISEIGEEIKGKKHFNEYNGNNIENPTYLQSKDQCDNSLVNLKLKTYLERRKIINPINSARGAKGREITNKKWDPTRNVKTNKYMKNFSDVPKKFNGFGGELRTYRFLNSKKIFEDSNLDVSKNVSEYDVQSLHDKFNYSFQREIYNGLQDDFSLYGYMKTNNYI